MQNKKMLVILSRYLWPVDGGRKESLNHYFKELHDNYHYKIKILCFLEATQHIDVNDFPYYIDDVKDLKDVSLSEKISNMLLFSLGGKKWPLQCSLYYSKKNCEQILKVVDEWKPDVIFTEMIRTCMYFSAFEKSEALLLANLDDLLSRRYLRQLYANNSKASFVGAYGEKMPKFISKLINVKKLRDMVLMIEAKRCKLWEKKFYEIYDYLLFTSDIERNDLNKIMDNDKAKTLSVGIDYEYYSENIQIDKKKLSISYLGNMSVASNADTLDMITEEILPLVKSDYQFYVVGKCPDEIKNKYIQNDKVIFCGRVDDLRYHLKSTELFLAPIAYGTGIKTKIVEAMAMGLPVITNSVGAEGLTAINGKDYLVSDSYIEIANYVDEILNNREKAREIGNNAEIYAKKNFNWEKTLKVFEEMQL